MGVCTDMKSPEVWTAGHRMDFAPSSLIRLLCRMPSCKAERRKLKWLFPTPLLPGSRCDLGFCSFRFSCTTLSTEGERRGDSLMWGICFAAEDGMETMRLHSVASWFGSFLPSWALLFSSWKRQRGPRAKTIPGFSDYSPLLQFFPTNFREKRKCFFPMLLLLFLWIMPSDTHEFISTSVVSETWNRC